MGGSFEKTDLLLLLAVFLGPSTSHVLTCHCFNGTECYANGYCAHGCAEGWFGPGCHVRNLALSKETNQSSTFFDYNYWYYASLAVDGLWPNFTDYAYYANTALYCSHTVPRHGGTSAWWLVVLDTRRSYFITNVTIINRKDRTASRLTNFVILYSDEVEGDPDCNGGVWHELAREMGTFDNKKAYTSTNNVVAKRVAVYLTAQNATNPLGILTLCEVQIYGYQQYDCQHGFTGPGCLLRSCDACESTGGYCTGDYRSCRYDVCPDRSLLPPECWITLSNYSGVEIRTTATCNTLQFSIDQPDTKPNIAASLLQLQVIKSAGRQMVMNTTLLAKGENTTTFKFDDATMYMSYEVSVKPLYCNTTNLPCFYAASSKVFTVRTGRREYVFSHNSSCVVVHIKSVNPDCELPLAIQVTCEPKGVDSDAVNSSSSTTCGLIKGREYFCTVIAVINAKTIEKQSANIFIDSLDAPPAAEKDMAVVAGSIGASVIVVVVVAVGIFVVVYRRRQRNTNYMTSAVAQDDKLTAHAPTGALNVTRLPKSNKEQNYDTYMSLHVEHGMQTTDDYAALNFTI